MNGNIKDFIEANTNELYRILRDLCLIPAPSGKEEKRAEYCKSWFDSNGMTDAYIDDALNVVFPYKSDGCNSLTVFAAHTDTVFPDTDSMPYSDDGETIHCPGVGDNTASVAVLMLCAKYIFESKANLDGVLFVCNSSEEGLGNLKGTRGIFHSYNGRIKSFVSFDNWNFNIAADRCVGSHRYEVTVCTEGGHSWEDFGKDNAISILSSIVKKIYEITLPEKEGKKVTYNVGNITGGTSVNTIAANASMLCEYRSDDWELLCYMQGEFERIFEQSKRDGVKISVKTVGLRPCENGVNPVAIAKMKDALQEIVKEVVGESVAYHSSSTDCNIPLSVGIPAINMGVYIGGGAHTRDEWIKKDSLVTGLKLGIFAIEKFSRLSLS